ncbi:MAG: metal ABC transporter substrate-binding protein [Dehalococcoidia bacterium]
MDSVLRGTGRSGARSAGVLLVVGAFLVSALVSACGDSTDGGDDDGGERLSVVASTALIAEFAREVGGDAIDVQALIPAGVDVHSFEPSTRVAAEVASADLVLVNGYNLEEGLLAIVVENVGDGVPVVAVSAGLEPRAPVEGHEHEHEGEQHEDEDPEGEEHEDDHHEGEEHDDEVMSEAVDALTFAEGDPHFWLSVPNVISYVEHIRDALVATDEANADSFNERASAYIARLEAVDDEIRDQMAAIPEGAREIVVFHDAFGYFAAEYGFEIAGSLAPGNPNQQPSAQDVAEVVEIVEEHGVPAIYAEPQFSSPLIEAVASETDTRVLVLHSQPGPDAETYEAMMRANAQALVEGLGGVA